MNIPMRPLIYKFNIVFHSQAILHESRFNLLVHAAPSTLSCLQSSIINLPSFSLVWTIHLRPCYRTVRLDCFARFFFNIKVQTQTHISMESLWQGDFTETRYECSSWGVSVLLAILCLSIFWYLQCHFNSSRSSILVSLHLLWGYVSITKLRLKIIGLQNLRKSPK